MVMAEPSKEIADFEAAKQAIVEVYPFESDVIAGTGFWLGGRCLMTCAHVVGKALNLKVKDYGNARDQKIRVCFAKAGHTNLLTVKVLYCKYEETKRGEDVAVLVLENPVCFEGRPIHLAPCFSQVFDSTVRSYAYICGKRGEYGGRGITATTNGSDDNGWIQVEVSQDRGMAIAEGVSGAPVWCDNANAFVGMIVARDDLRPDDRVGFFIPVEELSEPRRLIHRQLLLDVLKPHENRLMRRVQSAYQVCRSDYAVG